MLAAGRSSEAGHIAQRNGSNRLLGCADLIAFGVPYLANPDLPVRYAKGAPLNAADPATFYTGDEKGYADYPALA